MWTTLACSAWYTQRKCGIPLDCADKVQGDVLWSMLKAANVGKQQTDSRRW